MKAYDDIKNIDLYVREYGYEDCKPNHYYGPAVRECFLFHYIFSGNGTFQTSNATYSLIEGQGFLIFPDDLNYYQADDISPWSYGWLGITGIKPAQYFQQCGLTRENPIWNGGKDEFIEDCMLKLYSARSLEASRQPQTTGYAYLILARMIEKSSLLQPSFPESNRQETYLHAAIQYMEQHYYKSLRIEDIANYVGLDRSYLGAIFKKHLRTSMQNYLVDLRMDKACKLLLNANLRIADVARSVGYLDQLQFSKIFKMRKGISPLRYKKSKGEANDNITPY